MTLSLREDEVVRVGRVYDARAEGDRHAVLVDRLWPRGIRKDDAPFHQWLQAVAPSSGLRTFYVHRPELFDEFATRYRAELAADEEGGFRDLVGIARRGPVTLLTATRDLEHSGATVLAEELRRTLETPLPPALEDDVVAFGEILAGADGRGVLWGLERHHGINLNLVRLGPGDKIDAHVNDEVDVVLIGFAGSGVVTVDSDERFLTAGSFSLIGRGSRRSIAAVDAPFAYLSIHAERQGLTIRGHATSTGAGALAR